MNSRQSGRDAAALKIVAPAVPYLSVLVGLHLLGSGLIAIVGYHVGVCVILLASGNLHKVKSALRGSNALGYLLFVSPCLAAGAAIYLLWPVAHLPGLVLGEVLNGMGINRSTWPFVLAYSCAVNPLLEEVYWRDYLGTDARRPALTDLLFGGYHGLVLILFLEWYFAVLAVGCLVFAAWLWRQLRARYGGLAIPIAGHIAADASILLAIYPFL